MVRWCGVLYPPRAFILTWRYDHLYGLPSDPTSKTGILKYPLRMLCIYHWNALKYEWFTLHSDRVRASSSWASIAMRSSLKRKRCSAKLNSIPGNHLVPSMPPPVQVMSIDRAFCRGPTWRYSPPLRKNKMNSMSFCRWPLSRSELRWRYLKAWCVS